MNDQQVVVNRVHRNTALDGRERWLRQLIPVRSPTSFILRRSAGPTTLERQGAIAF
jgi:hypothetical protein